MIAAWHPDIIIAGYVLVPPRARCGDVFASLPVLSCARVHFTPICEEEGAHPKIEDWPMLLVLTAILPAAASLASHAIFYTPHIPHTLVHTVTLNLK